MRWYRRVRNWISAQVQDRPWLDHLARAGGRYKRQGGDYYAAGVTYFTVLSLFPLLMLAFSVAGFILSRHPETMAKAHDEIVSHVPGDMGRQIGDIVDKAVASRGSVGSFGLIFALYAGMGWMSQLRAALTEQWEQQTPEKAWWRTKLSDVQALIGFLLMLALSLSLSAVSSSNVGTRLLRMMHLEHSSLASWLLRLASVVAALFISWLLFTWVIARLPRMPVTFASAMRAGVLASVIFEAFKQVATIYLSHILTTPAGAVFGPIIGIMVFVYFTYRIVLFATAWAATAAENMKLAAD